MPEKSSDSVIPETSGPNRNKMAKIRVRQVRSSIKRPQNQKRTLAALGLRGIGKAVEHEDTPNILGMIKRVEHLVSVEKV